MLLQLGLACVRRKDDSPGSSAEEIDKDSEEEVKPVEKERESKKAKTEHSSSSPPSTSSSSPSNSPTPKKRKKNHINKKKKKKSKEEKTSSTSSASSASSKTSNGSSKKHKTENTAETAKDKEKEEGTLAPSSIYLKTPTKLTSTSAKDPIQGKHSVTRVLRSSTMEVNQGLESFRAKYKVTRRELGQGTFSVVRIGTIRETNEEVAVKVIDKKKSALSENFRKNLDREIEILTRVQHPNIVRVLDMYNSNEYFLIVMELSRGGELFDRVAQKGHYTEKDAQQLVKRIVQGVEYLHNNGIAHRDLKPENLLLKSPDNDKEVQIADFGLSAFIDSRTLMMTQCGTPAYVAPEVLLNSGYDRRVDLWSVGVITYVLLSGCAPFYAESVKALLQRVVHKQYHYSAGEWKDISEKAKNFIDCLLTDAENRLTAKEALEHPWLREEEGMEDDLPSMRMKLKTYMEWKRNGGTGAPPWEEDVLKYADLRKTL